LKNRLVGILVLLIIGMLLWPALFDQDISENVDTKSILPENENYIESFEINKTQDDLFNEPDIKDAEELISNDSLDAEKETAIKTVLRSKSKMSSMQSTPSNIEALPESWVIQVASFVEYNKALKLKDKLKMKGYNANLKRVNTSLGSRVRVFVGPELSKSKIKTLKNDIDKSFKVDSMITRFKHE
jgi:DedD protein